MSYNILGFGSRNMEKTLRHRSEEFWPKSPSAHLWQTRIPQCRVKCKMWPLLPVSSDSVQEILSCCLNWIQLVFWEQGFICLPVKCGPFYTPRSSVWEWGQCPPHSHFQAITPSLSSYSSKIESLCSIPCVSLHLTSQSLLLLHW